MMPRLNVSANFGNTRNTLAGLAGVGDLGFLRFVAKRTIGDEVQTVLPGFRQRRNGGRRARVVTGLALKSATIKNLLC